MPQNLTAGSRWISAVGSTEVIVVKAPSGASGRTLACGGHEMIPPGTARPTGFEIDPTLSSGIGVGKRFEHESGIEVLCTKAGTGDLTLDGMPLLLKESKSLPASD